MSAIISGCGRYRYRLERDGPGEGVTAVIMVNPSTADAEFDDHTIRKLRGFGERHKWGKLIVGNLFAYRATDIRDIQYVADPVGPENARHIAKIIHEADRIVFAWGPVRKQPKHYQYIWRATDHAVRLLLKQPLSIGPAAMCGHPKHPLMLGYTLPILPWSTPDDH